MFARASPSAGDRSLHLNAFIAGSLNAAAASLAAVPVAARRTTRYFESVCASFKRSVGCGLAKERLGTIKSKMASRIEYSEKYQDDSFEYRWSPCTDVDQGCSGRVDASRLS